MVRIGGGDPVAQGLLDRPVDGGDRAAVRFDLGRRGLVQARQDDGPAEIGQRLGEGGKRL